MKSPVTIRLADKDYLIRQLTLRTVRDLDLARSADLPEKAQDREAFFFDLYVTAISLALKEDHPDMTPEAILGLRTDLTELTAAYRTVMTHSGLVVGEVKAEAPNQ